MVTGYEERPSQKKSGFMTYLTLLIILAAFGVGIYYAGPTVVHKFKTALGWYDNEDENNVIADRDNA